MKIWLVDLRVENYAVITILCRIVPWLEPIDSWVFSFIQFFWLINIGYSLGKMVPARIKPSASWPCGNLDNHWAIAFSGVRRQRRRQRPESRLAWSRKRPRVLHLLRWSSSHRFLVWCGQLSMIFFIGSGGGVKVACLLMETAVPGLISGIDWDLFPDFSLHTDF